MRPWRVKRPWGVATALILVALMGSVWAGPETEKDILEELKLFSKALGVVANAYVGDVQPRDLLYKAVRGMLSNLDPYTEFIDKDRYELLTISMKGEYAGIGVKLQVIEDYPSIAEIQPGSAAEKAGLQLQDKIIKIDGVPMQGKAVTEVAKLLRGEAETPLLLSLMRAQAMLEVKIVRQKIEIESVKDVRMIGRALGYLRIIDFQEKTPDQAGKAIRDLRKRGMEALIIDLRFNDGGLLQKAVELAEMFLPEGKKIISVSSKIIEQRKEHVSKNRKPEPDYPIVILVNQISASASEIFTAAMQDNGRARIIGTKTFGKASVQSVVPLDDFSAMKLTTARYISPKGRVIDHVGVEPDEVVTNLESGQDADRQTLRALEIFKQYR